MGASSVRTLQVRAVTVLCCELIGGLLLTLGIIRIERWFLVLAVPDVFEVDVAHRHPEFLVLGSDGLYGEMSNLDIAQHVAKFRDAGEPNVSAALREAVLERVSQYYGFSAADMADIVPGERRNYHDDITIDVLHFAPPPSTPHAAAA